MIRKIKQWRQWSHFHSCISTTLFFFTFFTFFWNRLESSQRNRTQCKEHCFIVPRCILSHDTDFHGSTLMTEKNSKIFIKSRHPKLQYSERLPDCFLVLLLSIRSKKMRNLYSILFCASQQQWQMFFKLQLARQHRLKLFLFIIVFDACKSFKRNFSNCSIIACPLSLSDELFLLCCHSNPFSLWNV